MAADEIALQELFLDLTDEWHQTNYVDGGWYEPAGRGGVFGAALTIWLMILQGLHGCSMASALEFLKAGAADLILKRNEKSRQARAREISPNTGGYSRAKQRLPLVDIEDVLEVINTGLMKEVRKINRKELKVYALDGTNFVLEQTPAIEIEFPRGKYKHGTLHHPEMKAVFATEQQSGIATCCQSGPSRGNKAVSEQALSAKVIENIEDGALIIGDKNFGVFSVASHAKRYRKDVLVRMIDFRARKVLKHQVVPETDTIDVKLIWEKSADDQLLAPDDPKTVEGRLIRFILKKKGFRPLTLYLFTTSDLPVQKLVDIYGRRVDIETDIRYLKHMFKMERVFSKTPDAAKKEILIRFVAFNLVRRVVAIAAMHANLLPRQISFARAVGYTKVFGIHIINAQSQQEREILYAQYVKVLSQCKLPNRPKERHEPRMITRRKQRYAALKQPRDVVKKKLAENGSFR